LKPAGEAEIRAVWWQKCPKAYRVQQQSSGVRRVGSLRNVHVGTHYFYHFARHIEIFRFLADTWKSVFSNATWRTSIRHDMSVQSAIMTNTSALKFTRAIILSFCKICWGQHKSWQEAVLWVPSRTSNLAPIGKWHWWVQEPQSSKFTGVGTGPADLAAAGPIIW